MAYTLFLPYLPSATVTRFYNGMVYVYEINNEGNKFIGVSLTEDLRDGILSPKVEGKELEQLNYLQEVLLYD